MSCSSLDCQGPGWWLLLLGVAAAGVSVRCWCVPAVSAGTASCWPAPLHHQGSVWTSQQRCTHRKDWWHIARITCTIAWQKSPKQLASRLADSTAKQPKPKSIGRQPRCICLPFIHSELCLRACLVVSYCHWQDHTTANLQPNKQRANHGQPHPSPGLFKQQAQQVKICRLSLWPTHPPACPAVSTTEHVAAGSVLGQLQSEELAQHSQHAPGHQQPADVHVQVSNLQCCDRLAVSTGEPDKGKVPQLPAWRTGRCWHQCL